MALSAFLCIGWLFLAISTWVTGYEFPRWYPIMLLFALSLESLYDVVRRALDA